MAADLRTITVLSTVDFDSPVKSDTGLVRERMLILPTIGTIDRSVPVSLPSNYFTAFAPIRAKVIVIDRTGVPSVDSTVANHLVQAVDAPRLMGATVIVTGLSAEIAQTLVTIGVDLTKDENNRRPPRGHRGSRAPTRQFDCRVVSHTSLSRMRSRGCCSP